MSAQESTIDTISERYANALFDLAQEGSVAEKKRIGLSVKKLADIISSNDKFQQALRSPVIDAKSQDKAVQAILKKAKISDTVAKFAGLVVANRRAFSLLSILKAYELIEARARGEISAEVISSKKLSAAQTKSIKTQMKKAYGKDISITAITDPSILGGLILKVGSQMIDGSLRTKLNSLKQAMNEAD